MISNGNVIPSTTRIAVSIRDVSMVFKTDGRSVEAVKDLSLDVYKNECLSLVAASGAGKTTILNTVAGFLAPTSGKVVVNGNDVTSAGPDRGVVFQTNNLFPWKTVLQNVEFGSRMREVNASARRNIANDLLEAVGVADFASFYPPELSIGMQQRVALARAYANDPDILLMDEPFGSLDAQTALDMQKLLWSIREKSPKTIIFVTHNIEEAITVSDRIVVLNRRPASVKEIIQVELPHPRGLNADTFAIYDKLRTQIAKLI
jgi:NitT/TauT family transport system ATP-binding protein